MKKITFFTLPIIMLMGACFFGPYILNGIKMRSQRLTHQMVCDEPWFSFIKSGTKPVEGRKNSPKYRNIKIGDVIEFVSDTGATFKTLVYEVREYRSLENYLNDVSIEKALPGVSSLQEALNIYHQWSTPEEVKRYGFLGIFVKPI